MPASSRPVPPRRPETAAPDGLALPPAPGAPRVARPARAPATPTDRFDRGPCWHRDRFGVLGSSPQSLQLHHKDCSTDTGPGNLGALSFTLPEGPRTSVIALSSTCGGW